LRGSLSLSTRNMPNTYNLYQVQLWQTFNS
jgi:hypothetical protein